MVSSRFSWQSILIRFVIALALVFGTYNPHGKSFYHWAVNYFSPTAEASTSLPVLVLIGLVLLIGWTIYLRATFRSLGMFGLILAFAFFGTLVWLAIDVNLISLTNTVILTDIILVTFAGVLAVGISWSHIRRRISGQSDIDDVDE